MRRITVQLSDEMYRRIKILAAIENKKMYEIIQEALTQYLKNKEKEIKNYFSKISQEQVLPQ